MICNINDKIRTKIIYEMDAPQFFENIQFEKCANLTGKKYSLNFRIPLF